MAAFYADENFPFKAVLHLRRLGDDVVTIQESGLANLQTPDPNVLDTHGCFEQGDKETGSLGFGLVGCIPPSESSDAHVLRGSVA